MGLQRRIEAWQKAGIVDAETASRIVAYEEQTKRPMGLYALVGLGALAIGFGLIAIVASNWDAIPPSVKLGVDLLIGAGFAYAIYRTLRTGPRWASEALLVVYYLFVLASIGLLGQIYQAGAPFHVALGVWSLATLPMLLLVQTRFSAMTWAVGLASTYAANAIEWIDTAGRAQEGNIAAAALTAFPALCLLLGWLLRRTSPAPARLFGQLSWTLVALGTFLATFIWYVRVDPGDVTWGAGAAAVLVALGWALAWSWFQDRRTEVSLAFGTAFAVLLPPLLIPHDGQQLLGGILGLVVLAVFAYCAYRVGHRLAFSALTAALGIRIVTIYFEVFGSLMSTGVGLLTGGALTLGLAWLWARTSSGVGGALSGGADAA